MTPAVPSTLWGFKSRRANVLAVLVAVSLGVLCGLGAFTFGYGDGAAYLRDDPVACANCHVMQAQYDAWIHSSHRSGATCNDCHLSPHALRKWWTKADNGFFHSLAFTTGNFPDPIRIKPRNRRVAQAACLSCHAALVHALLPRGGDGQTPLCVHCHQSAGHALH